jgi:hypothetical protein
MFETCRPHHAPLRNQVCPPMAAGLSLIFSPSVDPEHGTGMQAYDIEIAMDDTALKAKMTAVHAPGDNIKRVAALDEEVRTAIMSF